MNDVNVFKMLSNLRSLRAYCRENLTLEQMQETLEKLQIVVSECKESESEALKIEKEKEDKLNVYREMLLADGIDPEELLASLTSAPKSKAKRAPRPAKYKFLTQDSEEKSWTGQGRMPSPLKDAIENDGKSLDDFLI